MKIVKQGWDFVLWPDGDIVLKTIEAAGRTCYKSEAKITSDSAPEFCKKMLLSGHHSVIEHQNITVRIITDRGVTHEIVRHRLASYSQESTRYCNYAGGVSFILPVWLNLATGEYNHPDQCPKGDHNLYYWFMSMLEAERAYSTLIAHDWTPQQARSVLPNSLKTEIVMTCNIREWRHFFTLRCSLAAHPQMRDLANGMLKGFQQAIPILFDDVPVSN
jgi:thymidylate synthase (FAD)